MLRLQKPLLLLAAVCDQAPFASGEVHGACEPGDPPAHQGPQVWGWDPVWRDGA